MNQQFDPLDDLARLAELEQQLKQNRPRPPRMDFSAIERIADHMEASKCNEIAIVHGRSQVDSRPLVSNYSSKQFAGAIAASWVIGVAVGASFVFYLTAPHQHAIFNQEASTTINSSAISPATEGIPPQDQSSLLTNKSASDAEVSAGRLVTDALEFDLNSGHLRVGNSLRSHGRLVRTMESVSVSLPIRRDDETVGIDASLASKFSPTQPVTRAELMRELRNAKNSTIH